MKTLIKSVMVPMLALLLSVSPALSEDRSRYQQPELDQILAPIALYPDSLLSQILMASTYPLEVVEAARWSRAHPHLKGQNAVRAVEDRDWEPSVKSLVAFPEVLSMMDQKPDWTERLGDAFLAQQEQVMDTVQDLRHRAELAGNLHSGDRARILRQGETIIIEPANPRFVYVPYYDPVIVYGPWWWPAYPPVYWSPWPGYYAGPAFVSGFYWGSGISISTGFFFGAFDWQHRHVRIVNVDYYRSHARVSRLATIVHDRPGAWRHDPGHRRGVPYRHAALREEARQLTSPRIDGRRNIQERNAAPAVRQDEPRQPGFRRGADNTSRSAAPGTTPGPRLERREDERATPGVNRQERESRERRESGGAQRERPVMRDNDRSESPGEGGRFRRNAEVLPASAPVVRQDEPRQPGFRRGADNTSRSAAPGTTPGPRLERREDERATPGVNRQERESRERRESGGAQRERPVMRDNDRSESPGEGGRILQAVQPRLAPAPAVRQAAPAETQKAQPLAQRFAERGNRPSVGGGEATRRLSASNNPPRAQDAEARRPDGDVPRRQFMPAAGRPAPG